LLHVVAGYSVTPLAKKLGIKEQTSVVAVGAPTRYPGTAKRGRIYFPEKNKSVPF
jgi:hypothetical protein